VLYLMVRERLARGEAVPGAVGTLMTNMAVELALKQLGVDFVRAAVGDRYVLEALEQQGWLLGGEASGHLLVLDKHTTGDGLVSALQVLQACVRNGQTLAQLLHGIVLYPQVNLGLPLRPGQDWRGNQALMQAIRAAEQDLGEQGRVLVRASGTEPLLRIMVEARDAAQAKAWADRLAAAAEVPP
jgi:phosphoglucosamine mutase